MTALLTADEAAALRVGVNVIVRPGDRYDPQQMAGGGGPLVHQFVAPEDWVALTGPCPTCGGLGGWRTDEHVSRGPDDWEHVQVDHDCPDCRDGRRIVPLYTACSLAGTHVSHSPLRCPTRLVGWGSIEVVPVVNEDYGATGYVWPLFDCIFVDTSEPDDHHAFLYTVADEMTTSVRLDPLPVPGRDWGIVLDVVEVVS